MRARLPEFFGVQPKAPLVVKMVEPFREKGSAAAFYEQPSADGSRPGSELAKKELGSKFDLRAFHDLVLGNGALPLNLLQDNVNAWIRQRK